MSQQELEIHMRRLISMLAPGTQFTLKDIILDPPASLGRRLYEDVANGTIPNVNCLPKIGSVERYIKL